MIYVSPVHELDAGRAADEASSGLPQERDHARHDHLGRERREYDRGELHHRSRSSSFRVGVDLVVVADVARSVQRFGDRYIDRIFTAHEIMCCRTPDRSQEPSTAYFVESLAARFAAKEATVKVLRPEGTRPDWRSIEVHREPGGWCEIRLRGRAAELAIEAGIAELAVSLTHESTMAAAVVVGMRSSGDRPVGRPDTVAWREE
ncbi:MAG TPA: holo-ACP synthase [Acidimicrobiales bacterium]|nr:holo-ACP synthase [Acidimicrobiales bacterium]